MVNQLLGRFRSADPADIDAWFEAIYPELERLIVTGQAAANTLTARYLVDHAAAEGFIIAPTLVTPEAGQIATALRVTGPVAFKRQIALSGVEDAARRVMTQQATGAARRLILAGARESVAATVAEATQIRGYRRVTSGSPCAFCAMLASRGGVYKSEATAGRDQQWHDHCVVGSTSVQGPRTELAYRRWYEGELIIVTTARGDELAITPKHPVLTDRGWVDAGELRQTDRLVHGIDVQSVPLGVPDEDQMPALIQDVWRAHAVDGLASMPVAAEDFHGDGVGTEGYVHVVAADGLLSTVMHALARQLYTEAIGAGTGSTAILDSLLAGGCSCNGILGAGGSPNGRMGGGGSGSELLGGELGSGDGVGFGYRPPLDPSRSEPSVDDSARHAVPPSNLELGLTAEISRLQITWYGDAFRRRAPSFGPRFDPPSLEEQSDSLGAKADLGARLLERLAGKVQLSCPVELRRVGGWSGHVFNLQTVEGWYSANNIVVSNCSCTTEPLYVRDSTPAPFAAEWAQAKEIAAQDGVRTDVAFRRLVEGRNTTS